MELWQLKQLQTLPLRQKVWRSTLKIRQWYEHWQGDVYVSFSGGKDSTALLDLVRSIYPDVPAVFVDTGLEFPEIRQFVRQFDNVVWLKPKMKYTEVLRKHGYPVVSKATAQKVRKLTTQNISDRFRNYMMNGDERGTYGKLAEKWKFLLEAPFPISERCCDVMKKQPVMAYERATGLRPFVGMMADDSRKRKKDYLDTGCNAFSARSPRSNPLAFWKESDIWEYIRSENTPYCSVYDDGYDRTGCVFCMFGIAQEGTPNRFQRLFRTHPKLWKHCMGHLGCQEVMDYLGFPTTPTEFDFADELTA